MEIIERDYAWATEQKMGCFIGVAQGSDEPLKFLEMHYRGAGDDSQPVVLVGKGVTFDSYVCFNDVDSFIIYSGVKPPVVASLSSLPTIWV